MGTVCGIALRVSHRCQDTTVPNCKRLNFVDRTLHLISIPREDYTRAEAIGSIKEKDPSTPLIGLSAAGTLPRQGLKYATFAVPETLRYAPEQPAMIVSHSKVQDSAEGVVG